MICGKPYFLGLFAECLAPAVLIRGTNPPPSWPVACEIDPEHMGRRVVSDEVVNYCEAIAELIAPVHPVSALIDTKGSLHAIKRFSDKCPTPFLLGTAR